jgi:hypothetical protein
MRNADEWMIEVSGLSKVDEVIESAGRWPPNLFALTSTLLAESGAYRRVVSPPTMKKWPPSGGRAWEASIRDRANAWRLAVDHALEQEDRALDEEPLAAIELPEKVAQSIEHLRNIGSLEALNEETSWETLAGLFELHALADEACSGLGLAEPRECPKYILEAARQLKTMGTLSTYPVDRVRVLPKTRTPQVGITLRSLSHHVAMVQCEVDVTWVRTHHPAAVDKQMRLRLLLFPWPFSIQPVDFQPVDGDLDNMHPEKFGFFRFQPASDDDDALNEAFVSVVAAAKVAAGDVDGVVLPECAVTPQQFDRLWDKAKAHGVHLLLAGVRSPRGNSARLRIDGPLERETYEQGKHHRWFLEERQIHAYGLQHVLNPSRRWWEDVQVTRRTMNVLAFNDWLTICHLICEDLARIDPVSQVVRAVGPTLVIALLLDGPQLPKRWPGRYATILAEDPGSSVLTVTSLGMAERSRPTPTDPPNRTIALWRDSKNYDVLIPLEEGAQGVVLTIWADRVEEFTADGRSDGSMAGRLTLGGVLQVKPEVKPEVKPDGKLDAPQ